MKNINFFSLNQNKKQFKKVFKKLLIKSLLTGVLFLLFFGYLAYRQNLNNLKTGLRDEGRRFSLLFKKEIENAEALLKIFDRLAAKTMLSSRFSDSQTIERVSVLAQNMFEANPFYFEFLIVPENSEQPIFHYSSQLPASIKREDLPRLLLSTPIRDNFGQTLGSARIVLRLDTLGDFLMAQILPRLRKDCRLILLDQDQNYLLDFQMNDRGVRPSKERADLKNHAPLAGEPAAENTLALNSLTAAESSAPGVSGLAVSRVLPDDEPSDKIESISFVVEFLQNGLWGLFLTILADFTIPALLTLVGLILLTWIAARQQFELIITRKQAALDDLTGVYNRRFALEFLTKLIPLARREKKMITICFIDVNNLKKTNDLHGHRVGDELIQKVVQVLRAGHRESDYLCRFGGDEFLMILYNCDEKKAGNFIKRALDAAEKINRQSRHPFKVGFSYGIVEYDLKSKMEIEEFIKIADDKMYAHKNSHKKTE